MQFRDLVYTRMRRLGMARRLCGQLMRAHVSSPITSHISATVRAGIGGGTLSNTSVRNTAPYSSTFWTGPETIARGVRQGTCAVEPLARRKVASLKLGFGGDTYGYSIDLGSRLHQRLCLGWIPTVRRRIGETDTLAPMAVLQFPRNSPRLGGTGRSVEIGGRDHMQVILERAKIDLDEDEIRRLIDAVDHYEAYLHSQQRDETKYRELLVRLRKMLRKRP